ncbi:MAG: AAA family ATPase, partial [bacterium]|nr:AAA family ATPase [bacterium]
MRLRSIELSGFKSFAKKTPLQFASTVTAIVGPNGSGKSNIAESFRFVLGEQSMKNMRGRRGEDMIWNGSSASPRAGRAAVKLIFDNSDRALALDFDEVVIERVVHRDGGNDYVLNGSVVRLRDIAELLAQANIGSSGHHIISQGEADRILSASARDRRKMLEDALGLTAYLYKRQEAVRKLEKTAENMREVESLRRELAPHIRFLQGQVKKIEESQTLRTDLLSLYLEYLKRESVYLSAAETLARKELDAPQREHATIDATIAQAREELSVAGRSDSKTQELIQLEQESRVAAATRERATRELGRVEGELALSERLGVVQEEHIPRQEARAFAEGLLYLKTITDVVVAAKKFLDKIGKPTSSASHDTATLVVKKSALEKELDTLQTREHYTARSVEVLRKEIETEKNQNREAERELFAAMARRSELGAALVGLRAKEELLKHEREEFKVELGEAAALLGRDVLAYESYKFSAPDEPRSEQPQRHRKIERIKIRLEESGAGGHSEILKEHQETTQRDQFLARELADLASSASALNALIDDLHKTLEVRFASGIEKINTEFETFFKLMFGGGTAALSSVRSDLGSHELRSDLGDEQIEVENGIEIAVSLPHKRVKGLEMLSGGERALTSIALIFAMSQVNPPPFLILDETDAALDEANSRRYGDMIENLA